MVGRATDPTHADDPARDVLAALVDRAAALAAGGRAVLGLVGAPAAGKSTVALALTTAIPGSVVVPMDGYHRPTAWLQERGLVEERGSPRTFDSEGYLALLRRLRTGEPTCAPSFDRSVEEPVPDAIDIPASARLVITEGNYLLLDAPPWSSVPELLDEVWFLDVPERVRLSRLVARHVAYGREPGEARERATHGTDARNAELVAASRSRADLLVRLP